MLGWFFDAEGIAHDLLLRIVFLFDPFGVGLRVFVYRCYKHVMPSASKSKCSACFICPKNLGLHLKTICSVIHPFGMTRL